MPSKGPVWDRNERPSQSVTKGCDWPTPANHIEVQATARQVRHDDVIEWKHYPRYWPFVRGIHRAPGNSPHKGQWRGALVFSLICVWINGWVDNREAGDLRRHRAHYDVIVMVTSKNPVHVFHILATESQRNFAHILLWLSQFSIVNMSHDFGSYVKYFSLELLYMLQSYWSYIQYDRIRYLLYCCLRQMAKKSKE